MYWSVFAMHAGEFVFSVCIYNPSTQESAKAGESRVEASLGY
jgi:hypothetical protein